MSRKIKQYHVQFDEHPQSYWDALEADGFWDEDLGGVRDEAEIHRSFGRTNVRIIEREIVVPSGELYPSETGVAAPGWEPS